MAIDHILALSVHLLFEKRILVGKLWLLVGISKCTLGALAKVSVGSRRSCIVLPERLVQVFALVLVEHLIKQVGVIEVDKVIGLKPGVETAAHRVLRHVDLVTLARLDL